MNQLSELKDHIEMMESAMLNDFGMDEEEDGRWERKKHDLPEISRAKACISRIEWLLIGHTEIEEGD